VAQAVDVLSHNSFPYFEEKRQNSIDKASDNFWSAVAATESVAQGKPVWITETGWPDCRFSTLPRLTRFFLMIFLAC